MTASAFARIHEKVSAHKDPLEWLALLTVIVGGVMLGKVAVAASHDPPRLQARMVAALALPFLFFFRWQSLVLFVPVWIIFEALARRYIVNDVAIFFVKDAILLVAYFKTFGARWLRGRPAIRPTPANLPLACLLVWSVIAVFNPHRYSLMVGILGLRVSFWYVPMMFLVGEIFRTKDDLLTALKRYVFLGAAVAIFGFVQWAMGPASILAKTYLEFDAYYATASGIVIFRAMSTFAANAAFAQYLLFVTLFSVVCFKVRSPVGRLSRIQKLIIVIAVLLGVIATGQASLGALIPLILLAVWFRDAGSSGKGMLVVGVVFGGAIAALLLWAVIPVMGSIWGRFLMAADPVMLVQRLIMHVFEPIPRALGDALMGHGTGSQGQGLQYLIGVKQARALFTVEGGYSKLAWELGLIGLVTVMWVHLALMVWAVRISRSLRDQDLRWIAFIGIMLQVCTLLWMLISNILDHSTYAILFWSVVGIVGALPRLERRAVAGNR